MTPSRPRHSLPAHGQIATWFHQGLCSLELHGPRASVSPVRQVWSMVSGCPGRASPVLEGGPLGPQPGGSQEAWGGSGASRAQPTCGSLERQWKQVLSSPRLGAPRGHQGLCSFWAPEQLRESAEEEEGGTPRASTNYSRGSCWYQALQ